MNLFIPILPQYLTLFILTWPFCVSFLLFFSQNKTFYQYKIFSFFGMILTSIIMILNFSSLRHLFTYIVWIEASFPYILSMIGKGKIARYYSIFTFLSTGFLMIATCAHLPFLFIFSLFSGLLCLVCWQFDSGKRTHVWNSFISLVISFIFMIISYDIFHFLPIPFYGINGEFLGSILGAIGFIILVENILLNKESSILETMKVNFFFSIFFFISHLLLPVFSQKLLSWLVLIALIITYLRGRYLSLPSIFLVLGIFLAIFHLDKSLVILFIVNIIYCLWDNILGGNIFKKNIVGFFFPLLLSMLSVLVPYLETSIFIILAFILSLSFLDIQPFPLELFKNKYCQRWSILWGSLIFIFSCVNVIPM